MIAREVRVCNRLGLHARAAARFVNTASRFGSRVSVVRDRRRMDGKSILGILLLAAPCGARLVLEVEGPDEEQAADALEALVCGGFGEGGESCR